MSKQPPKSELLRLITEGKLRVRQRLREHHQEIQLHVKELGITLDDATRDLVIEATTEYLKNA